MRIQTLCCFVILLCWMPNISKGQKLVEKIDRGVVALNVENKIYVGWRLLSEDPENVAFNVYRKNIGIPNEFVKVNNEPVTNSTDRKSTRLNSSH